MTTLPVASTAPSPVAVTVSDEPTAAEVPSGSGYNAGSAGTTDTVCGEVENPRPPAYALADVARDAGEVLAVAGMVTREVRREGRLPVVEAVGLALVEMARDAERIPRLDE